MRVLIRSTKGILHWGNNCSSPANSNTSLHIKQVVILNLYNVHDALWKVILIHGRGGFWNYTFNNAINFLCFPGFLQWKEITSIEQDWNWLGDWLGICPLGGKLPEGPVRYSLSQARDGALLTFDPTMGKRWRQTLVSKAGVVNHLGLSFSVSGVVRGAGVPGEALRWPLPEHTHSFGCEGSCTCYM